MEKDLSRLCRRTIKVLDELWTALHRQAGERSADFWLQSIFTRAASETGCDLPAIRSGTRTAAIVRGRELGCLEAVERGFTRQQIAGYLGCSVSAVGYALRRARERQQHNDGHASQDYCGGCSMLRSQCQCWDPVNPL